MYLYGAGGHAKVIRDILESCNIELSGVIDDNIGTSEFMGIKVMHSFRPGESPVIISIGSNGIRKKIAERLASEGVTFGTAIHGSAIVSKYATIEEGSVVMQGSIVQSCSRIGKHSIINSGASIDHECVLGDYVHISPHATLCGNVIVGEGTWIGAGTIVNPGVRIGKWSIIGSGSVVCKDIPDMVVAYGSPCRIVRNIEDHG